MGFSTNINYSVATGGNSNNAQVIYFSTVDPTINNTQFPIGKLWFNTTDNNIWILVDFTTSTGVPLANWQSIGSDLGVITIDGDTGSATPLDGVITFNANSNSGSSVEFVAASHTVDLEVTDASSNTIIGSSAGNATLSGSSNVGLGSSAFHALTSGSSNTAIGVNSGALLTTGAMNAFYGAGTGSTLLTGSNNTILGYSSGTNYVSSESSNILIGEGVSGTAAESHALRIGNATGTSAGNINKAFIAGINSVTASNPAMVTINTSTDQLGVISVGATGTVLIGNTGTNPSFSANPVVTSITFGAGSALGTYTTGGTWTPTLVGGTVAGTTTYSTQTGTYTRIGNVVTACCQLAISAATGTGDAVLSGLPFTAASVSTGALYMDASGWTWPTGGTSLAIYLLSGGTSMRIVVAGSTEASQNMQMTNAAATFIFTITYLV